MPSRHAHRAALRRSKEPLCIPPAGLDAMPALPAGYGWRNPVRGYDYDRAEWQLYRDHPGGSETLVVVRAEPEGYAVERREAAARRTHAATEALAWAAEAAAAP